MNLLGTKTSKYNLSEIHKVQIESKLTDEGDKTFRLELILVDGQKLQLPIAYTLSEPLAKEGAYRISAFLDLATT